ncbi:dTMP kinase [Spiroplasma endosymbiont of Labia minor]|uniref:dTMP kinase n=1 Tax=Spiroplasma endosymbiont of Labia minor TaxID=3066305 RepID=UPI003BB10B3B
MFVTFEGIDGSGKTTIIKLLIDKIRQRGYDVISTREPGGDEIAEQIRNVVLDVNNKNMSPWAEALLYIAARKQHLDSTIIPALKNNKIVICDRFMDSTTVYQGFARGLGMEEVDEIQRIVLNHATPDVTIFFDINPDQARQRINERQKAEDRLDSENLAFHKKVYEGYQILISQNSDRIKIVDARQEINDVIQKVEFIILEAIESVLNNKNEK